MRFNPIQVLGTGISGLAATITIVSTRDLLAVIAAFLTVLAAGYTILNGHLNARKTRLEIKRLEAELGLTHES